VSPAVPTDLAPIAWVDEYVERVRPYVFVRSSDRILIKRPNQAYRMNESAISILDRLFNRGESVAVIVNEQRDRGRVIADLARFFTDLRCLLTHGLPEGRVSSAVRVVPFEFPFSRYPILAELAVTYSCNLRCRFCYAGCHCTRGPADRAGELDTAAMKRILEIIWHEAKVPSVSFTGGEPTTRPDLPELVEHARGLGLRTNLITNGTRLTVEGVRRLVEAGLNSAQVSVEGTSAELHDAVTQVRGSFERSLACLHDLRRAGVFVHANTTLNRLNLENGPDMQRFAKEQGLQRFSMNLMMPVGAGRNEPDMVVG